MDSGELKLKLFRQIDTLEKSDLEMVSDLVHKLIQEENDATQRDDLTEAQPQGSVDVEKRKYKIIKKLRKVEEPEKLYKIEKVLDIEELHPLLAQLLEKSNAEAEKKKGKPHKEVMAEVRQKFPIQKDA